MGQTFETPGIISSIQSYKTKKRSEQIANDKEQLELIKEAARVSKELQFPISALGIEVSRRSFKNYSKGTTRISRNRQRIISETLKLRSKMIGKVKAWLNKI